MCCFARGGGEGGVKSNSLARRYPLVSTQYTMLWSRDSDIKTGRSGPRDRTKPFLVLNTLAAGFNVCPQNWQRVTVHAHVASRPNKNANIGQNVFVIQIISTCRVHAVLRWSRELRVVAWMIGEWRCIWRCWQSMMEQAVFSTPCCQRSEILLLLNDYALCSLYNILHYVMLHV